MQSDIKHLCFKLWCGTVLNPKPECNQAAPCSVYKANVLRGGSSRANYCTINLMGHLKEALHTESGKLETEEVGTHPKNINICVYYKG